MPKKYKPKSIDRQYASDNVLCQAVNLVKKGKALLNVANELSQAR